MRVAMTTLSMIMPVPMTVVMIRAMAPRAKP
jgi:hypothetical protein